MPLDRVEWEMVARGGIEPPTRGFSVARSAGAAARKSKIRQGFHDGVEQHCT
jgi:hypothetical protein